MKKYEIGLYEKAMPGALSWEEKLVCAKECGYDFIELSIDETDEKQARLDWSPEEILELNNLTHTVGIPFRSICLSGHRKYPLGSSDEGTRKKSLVIMEKAVELADKLGIRIIQLAGYDVYYEESTAETKHFFLENLALCTDMAAVKGIVLGFETMETSFMDTVWKSMYFVRKIGSPYLGVYPDSGNLTNASVLYGTDVLEDLASGKGHLVALHLKETVPGKYREIPFFTGHVDFKAMISKAWVLGIRRYVTEMWDTGKEDWKKDIITANTNIRNLLDTAEQLES